MIEPEDDGCGDAGVDASPVLEPAEHDFDLVALAIERGIVGDRHLAVAL